MHYALCIVQGVSVCGALHRYTALFTNSRHLYSQYARILRVLILPLGISSNAKQNKQTKNENGRREKYKLENISTDNAYCNLS